MEKLVWFWFQWRFFPLTMLLVEKSLETELFRHLFNYAFQLLNFGNKSAIRVIFFWKCLKFNLHIKNAKRNRENNFSFWDNCIWIGCQKLSLLKREYLSSTVNMLTNILKNLHITKRHFLATQLPSQWSIDMVKVVSFRFYRSLVPLTILFVQGSSETGLFRHLFNHVFRSLWFRKYISQQRLFSLKMFKT